MSLKDYYIDIKGNYPQVVHKWKPSIFEFSLILQPTIISKKYQVDFKCIPNKYPEVRITKNQLDNIHNIPHIYTRESIWDSILLCLFCPKNKEFTINMKLSDTIIPWTIEWLFFYEIWTITGIWEGGGHIVEDGSKKIPERIS